jgi:hypothetical protein
MILDESVSFSDYASMKVAAAYANLKEESVFADSGASKFRLLVAGAVVTLLVPLKVASLLILSAISYAWLPISLVICGLCLLLRKVGATTKSDAKWFGGTRSEKIDDFLCVASLWPVLGASSIRGWTIKKNGKTAKVVHALFFLPNKIYRALMD